MAEKTLRSPQELETIKAPAVAELRGFIERNNLGQQWLTGAETAKIIEKAVQKTTEPEIRQSVRNQLFLKLVETNPEKAIAIEMKYYESRQLKVPDGLREQALSVVGKEFKTPQEAHDSYRNASELLRRKLNPSEQVLGGKPGEEEHGEKGKGTPKKTAGYKEQEIARRAFDVLARTNVLVAASNALDGIDTQKTDEYYETKGITTEMYKAMTPEKQKRAAQEATDFVRSTPEYKEAAEAVRQAFTDRNEALKDLGFERGDVRFTTILVLSKTTGRAADQVVWEKIDPVDKDRLDDNIKLFNAMVAPIMMTAIDQQLANPKMFPEMSGVPSAELKKGKASLYDAMVSFNRVVEAGLVPEINNEPAVVDSIERNYAAQLAAHTEEAGKKKKT